jgi:fibronectin type 3 domain-containing protein
MYAKCVVEEDPMNSRVRSTALLMLVALVISLIPVTGNVRPASALATCDWAQFIADVTIPDGTYFSPGATFSKTWRLKNIGTCTWTTGYALVFDSGSQMGGASSYSMPTSVSPGATVDITIPTLTAPNSAGHYIGYWKLRNASGVIFGIGSTANKSFWVEINVSSTSGGGGSGYDFTANAASATWRSGAGSLSFPGTDGSSNGYALRRDRPKFESGVESSQPGLLFAPNNVTNGYIQATYPAMRVQSGDRFQATIGCEYGATSCYVAYRLDYQIGSGAVRTFWSFREKYEGFTYPVDLNLNSLAGYDVNFILVVSAYGSPTGDKALWGNPIIARAGGTPPPPPPPPLTGFNFDFGTASSPVASGYTRVSETTGYSAGGHGWTDISALSSRDRGGPDALQQDFVMNDTTQARTFKVDLSNATYNVTVTMGDKDYVHDNMIVKANGSTVLADVDNAAGAFTANTFSVTVSGGSLSLEFNDGGGSDASWVVNAVTIASTTPPTQSNCTDKAQFISDVTIPDGTVISPGAAFVKTWRLKNIGTCTWTTAYSMIFDSGSQMSGASPVMMPSNVAPGANVDLTVNLVAPTSIGTYRGYWKFKNAAGVPFGIGSSANKSWWVEIKVTTTITNTPGTPSTPIAGAALDFVARMCEAAWFSSAGQLPCPGTDGDGRGFVLRVNNPKLENNTTDSRPGLLTHPQNVTNGYIQGIYPPYRVQSGDRFRSIVDCEYGATACYVVFRLDYQVGSGGIQTLWAFVERHEGQYYQTDISLASLVGQDVKFILTVLATGSPSGDRAMWVAPMISGSSSAPTSTPTLPVTGTPTLTPTVTSTPTATHTPTNTLPAPSSYKLDFGTASSALQTGYTRVTETTAYTAGGFGWTDTSALSSRDRGAPADALRQDFVMNDTSGARSFKMDLPNDDYNVTVIMGDNDYTHDNMMVKADGVVKLADVDNAAGAFTSNTFSVTVSGGSLSLEFSDAGGSDATWVINSIDVTAAP